MKHGIEVYGSFYREVVERARDFRQAPTRSEAALWQALRARRLRGLKFRRQHPVGPFILDFYCPAHRLAVEVDGPIHAQQPTRDRLRQKLIEQHRIRFVRLTSAEVEKDLDAALLKIHQAVAANP
jgi:very-short-patch-repair endonuclease